MTIRDAINEILSGLELGTDPAEVLADHGFENVSPEAFSSALAHFAEQAPLEVADALSPILSRVSPVPFEAGDLPDHPAADSLLDQGGDVFSLLTEVGLGGPDLAGLGDDPGSELDDAVDGAFGEIVDEATGALDEAAELADAAESTFGDGGEEAEPGPDADDGGTEADEASDLAEIGADALDDAVDAAQDLFNGVDTADFTDLFDREAASIDDLDDTDPSDLDFE